MGRSILILSFSCLKSPVPMVGQHNCFSWTDLNCLRTIITRTWSRWRTPVTTLMETTAVSYSPWLWNSEHGERDFLERLLFIILYWTVMPSNNYTRTTLLMCKHLMVTAVRLSLLFTTQTKPWHNSLSNTKMLSTKRSTTMKCCEWDGCQTAKCNDI